MKDFLNIGLKMSNVWFSSDLHLGHRTMARLRGFNSPEEHDEHILSKLQVVGKKDKLFVLGDVAWKKEHLAQLKSTPGVKELIFGNHDKLHAREYLTIFQKLHGFRNYKNFWLSHCPILPQEIRRMGNIHGHIHKTNTITTQPEDQRYFNVNIDMNDMNIVNFDTILERFK